MSRFQSSWIPKIILINNIVAGFFYKDSYRLIEDVNYQVKKLVKESQFFQRIGILVQVLSERKQK